MKKLSDYGVQEMNSNEVEEVVNGGWIVGCIWSNRNLFGISRIRT